MTKRNQIAGTIALLFILTNSAQSGDWTRWRGPNADGISAETSWKPSSLNNKSCLQWEINVGKGHSAVVVKGNSLYTLGETTNAGSVNETVYCIDNRSGKTLWQHTYPSEEINFPGPRTTPVLDDTHLYVLGTLGDLFCFEAETGKIVWQKNIVADGLSQKPDWYFAGSPVVEGNLLLLTAGKSGLALDKKNGNVIWKSEPEKCGLTTPVLFNNSGKKIAIVTSEKHFYGVDLSNGKRLWEFQWEAYNDPVPFQDRIYLSGETRGNTLLKIVNNQPNVVWENKNMVDGFQNCVLIDGYIYGHGTIRNRMHLQCIDMKTGELKWKTNLGQYGSLTAADHKLVVLTGDGNLIIAEATPAEYREISRAQVLTMPDNTNVPQNKHSYCWTSPVLSNGKIYARNNYGYLACIDVRK